MVSSGTHGKGASTSPSKLDAVREVKRAEEEVREKKEKARERAQAILNEARQDAREIIAEAEEEASKEAELIVNEAKEEAQSEADQILADAEERAEELRNVSETRLEEATDAVVERFKDQIGGV